MDCQKYREIQLLAYQAVLEAKAKLYAGITEIEAAQLVDDFLSRAVILFFSIVPLPGLVIGQLLRDSSALKNHLI